MSTLKPDRPGVAGAGAKRPELAVPFFKEPRTSKQKCERFCTQPFVVSPNEQMGKVSAMAARRMGVFIIYPLCTERYS